MTQSIPQPGQYPPPEAPTQQAPHHAAPASEARPSIGSLVALVTSQLSGILRDEIELNKTKARAFAAKSGKGAGLLITAAVFALFLLGWTLHTVEVLVVPAWAASLIVVMILLVIVATLALAGKNALQSAQKHRPDPAASVAATKEAIEKGLGK